MKFWAKLAAITATLAVVGAIAVPSQADEKEDKKRLREFEQVWSGKKTSTREKFEAVQNLPTSTPLVAETYIEVLEGDVWQWRAEVMLNRLTRETNEELLGELAEFLFDEKDPVKQPSAAEHLIFGLFNNATFATPERWNKAADIVTNKKMPAKVKYRMIRELGRWRGAETLSEVQIQMKANVKTLIDLLEFSDSMGKKQDSIERFLIINSLESLTSEEFVKHEKWDFWFKNLKEEPLAPRKAQVFKDEMGDIDIEGHSFVRKTPRKVEGMEILILPEFGYSEEYWYPYIFELNKTAQCTFVQLPDASRVKDLERPTDRTGAKDPNAYFYPLEKLVETFEQRRKDSKQEKVGLIAHGVTGWIALEYCRLYPESVAFAIIMGTWTGQQSYRAAITQLEGSKDDDFSNFGNSLNYDPTNRRGPGSMDQDQLFHGRTGSFKRMWADPDALEPVLYGALPDNEGQRLYGHQIGDGTQRTLVPSDYEFDKLAKRGSIDVPALFIWGEQDLMFVEDDEKTLSKIFSKGMFEVFAGASRTPWAEQPTLFYEKFDELVELSGVIPEKEDD